ncbi:MAG: DUF1877 family protein [Kofleriaceae bacterium]
MSLGVLFAITDKTVAELLAADDDDEIVEIIAGIEEAWDKNFLCETDKAWDAMHRALSDGTLDYEAGTPPLNRALLGGRQLCEGDDNIVVLVEKAEVPEVARALAAIDAAEMRRRYNEIVPRDYAPEYGDDDREYTVTNFLDVVKLYQRAAKAKRAVIFTVDQ